MKLTALSQRLYGKDVYASDKDDIQDDAEGAASPKHFWWVFGYTSKGKPVLLGPLEQREVADEKAEKLDDGRVYELRTKSQPKATKMIRAILLDEGAEADEALRRQLHEKGLEKEGG